MTLTHWCRPTRISCQISGEQHQISVTVTNQTKYLLSCLFYLSVRSILSSPPSLTALIFSMWASLYYQDHYNLSSSYHYCLVIKSQSMRKLEIFVVLAEVMFGMQPSLQESIIKESRSLPFRLYWWKWNISCRCLSPMCLKLKLFFDYWKLQCCYSIMGTKSETWFE